MREATAATETGVTGTEIGSVDDLDHHTIALHDETTRQIRILLVGIIEPENAKTGIQEVNVGTRENGIATEALRDGILAERTTDLDGRGTYSMTEEAVEAVAIEIRSRAWGGSERRARALRQRKRNLPLICPM